MKKLIAIASMLLLLPLSASGLTVMEDSQMNDITAQAGVSIALDVNLGLHVDTIAWGDRDGTTQSTTDGQGWVGISDMNAELFFGLRSDIAGTLGSDGTDILPTEIEVLTIDVATDATLYNNTSFVRIGLGTFELSGDMDMDFELGATNALGEELGTLDITNMIVRGAPGSYVDITTNGADSGVTLNLNVLLDEIHMDALAWGDTGGMEIYESTGLDVTSTGYVGLTSMDITDLNITGLVGIDVATAGADFAQILEDLEAAAIADPVAGALTFYAGLTYQERTMMKLALLKTYNSTKISDTMVILTLGNASGTVGNYTAGTLEAGDLNISMATMSANASIGSANDLTGAAEMGQIYIGGANVAVDGMVAIGAH